MRAPSREFGARATVIVASVMLSLASCDVPPAPAQSEATGTQTERDLSGPKQVPAVPAKQIRPTGTRTERDLLGTKQVPADAYYGVQTARAVENFQISGMKMDFFPEFVQAYAMVKLA